MWINSVSKPPPQRTPLQAAYAKLAQRPDFEADPLQLDALAALQAVIGQIDSSRQHAWFGRQPAPQGLWLWGPVGRGKTLLMDLFFDALPGRDKQRFHFHRFMQQVHQDLAKVAGHPEPLTQIAKQLASTTRVICFDEFFVSDIADAMLLGRLFQQLFRRGVLLVATSNQHPDQLYHDGLQRQRFLPAIESIKQHCQIHHMQGNTDHRLRQLHGAELFIDATAHDADSLLRQHLSSLNECASKPMLEVAGRQIPCRGYNTDTVWFNFTALCEGPRSQLDYIDLAERFETLILSDIPALGSDGEALWVVQGTEDQPASSTNQRRFLNSNDDRCRRFISLVDELYDRSVTLVASCQVGIQQLYPDGPLAFAFERTRSRLLEMQSQEYLQRPKRN
ncbi:MAG: cell division protein ZapE [Halopseudomonas sp.]